FLEAAGLENENFFAVVVPAESELLGWRRIHVDVHRGCEVTREPGRQLCQPLVMALGMAHEHRVAFGRQPFGLVTRNRCRSGVLLVAANDHHVGVRLSENATQEIPGAELRERVSSAALRIGEPAVMMSDELLFGHSPGEPRFDRHGRLSRSVAGDMKKTRIRNAQVVLPHGCEQIDVLIEGTRIADLDPARHLSADEDIDAEGLYLLPGVIDDQGHFREPGLTHKEDLAHATRACAKGGVTTFLEMPNTRPSTTTQQRIEEKLRMAEQQSLVNYGFYIGATPENLDELKQARRTPGIKIFIGPSTGELLVDEQDVLERIFAETSLPITAHCEDESTIRANLAR